MEQSIGTDTGKWELIWSDEFDYEGIPDTSKWRHEEGFIRNEELQYYTSGRKENVRVENGTLILEARKESFPNPKFDADKPEEDWKRSRKEAAYTSGSITTNGKMGCAYGRIEVKAKLPVGRGIWPAIWMLGCNINEVPWPDCGEIDIMEYVGYAPDLIHANTHTAKASGPDSQSTTITLKNPNEDFHIYAIEWFENRIDFYLDDIKYHSYENDGTGNASWPFDKKHYLILNIAVGGGWGGTKGVDDSIFPQQMLIDYVRVYKQQK